MDLNQNKKVNEEKNRFYHRAKISNTENAWKKHRESRNEVVKEIRVAKRTHSERLENRIKDASSSEDKIW